MKLRPYFLGVLFLVLLGLIQQQCANTVSPTGGPRDTSPPKIDSSKTTPNFSTNFKDNEIVLTFEEWVKLNDASNQVVISPFLEEKPDIKLKGKSVRVTFNEELKENTTYTIAFGNAIQTLKESKADENFRFIFSTGPEIDSLGLSGTVANASDKVPVEDFYVLLYDNLDDSVILSQRPFYFAKTDNNGRFSLSNIKADTFRVFALKDNNFNYNFDLPSEEIGFVKEPLILTDSTNQAVLKILVFQEAQELKLVGKQAIEPGLIRVRFNQKPLGPVNLVLSPEDASAYQYIESKGDSMLLWLNRFDVEQAFIISDGKELRDTFSLKLPKKEKLKKPQVAKRSAPTQSRAASGGKGGKGGVTPVQKDTGDKNNKPSLIYPHNPDQLIRLLIDQPLEAINAEKINMLLDSTETIAASKISIDSSSTRTILIEHKWVEDKRYDINFEAGAVRSIYGLENDPFNVSYTINNRKSFGSIDAKVTGMDSSKTYLIELVDRKDDVLDRIVVSNETSFEKNYPGMDVKSYMLRVLEDDNNNGQWDTGNYREGRQAEAQFFSEFQAMRPNWDMELQIVLPKKE